MALSILVLVANDLDFQVSSVLNFFEIFVLILDYARF